MIETYHKRITDQILPSTSEESTDFPEETLTEDEKCALFYSISHTVNETAMYDEDIHNTYQCPIHTAREAQGNRSRQS